MTEKEILEEYKELLKESKKIDYEQTKKFCLKSLSTGLGCITLEAITKREIFSPIFLGSIAYFSWKDIIDSEYVFYPITKHSLYQKILQDYQTYNQNIIELIIKSNENNPAFIAGIYKILLNKGYFSYNKNIYNTSINNPYFILPKEHLGLHLIKGICNNKYITIHFKDFLNELGIINSTLPIYINKKFIQSKQENWNIESIDTIEKDLAKKNKLDNFCEYQTSKIIGNWWINICKSIENDKIYYIDILNELFYQKKNNHSLNYYNTKEQSNLSIPIKFLNEKIYYKKGNIEFTKELLNYNNAPQEEINKYYLLGQKYTNQNIELFDYLYNNNKNILIDIENNLSKLENTILKYETKKRTKSKTKTHKLH